MQFPPDVRREILGRLRAEPEHHWTPFSEDLRHDGHTVLVTVDGLRYSLHRWLYEELIGSIPKRFLIPNCSEPSCQNPWHRLPHDHPRGLVRPRRTKPKAGRVRGNALAIAAANRAKTHCPHGHKYTPENTYVSKTGKRQCRRCSLLRAERQRREKKK